MGLFLVVVVTPLAFLPFSTSPFADLKLVTLTAGVLILWISRPQLDRPLAVAAAVWFAVAVAAAAFGVDPRHSLTGNENSPQGLLLVGVCGYLIAAGAAMPKELVERLPRWITGTAAAVAIIAIIWRVWPDALGSVMPGLSLADSTMGQGTFFACFVALGLIALPHVERARWRLLVGGVIFGAALGGTPHRSAVILSAIGFALGAWHARDRRKAVLLVAAAAVPAFLVWGLFLSADSAAPITQGGRSALATSFTDRQPNSVRVASLEAMVRSGVDRPLLGWGPGNGLSAWTAGLRPQDFPVIEEFADAHNILVEVFATTGILGSLAFLVMVGIAARRILRRPRPTGWLAGCLLVLVLFHLFEPLNLALTSMAFLLAGAAARPTDLSSPPVARRPAAGRLATGVLLVAALLVAVLTCVSAICEQYERTYFEKDHGPLRLAVRITPWRTTSEEDLAVQLAVDGRAGIAAAKEEALSRTGDMLAQHPWDPGVYLVARQVHLLLLDPQGAEDVMRAFSARFPSVPVPDVQILPPLAAVPPPAGPSAPVTGGP